MDKEALAAMQQALREDWEGIPRPTIPRAGIGRNRLSDLAEQFPNPGAVLGFVTELIARSQAQFGASIGIGARFAHAVQDHGATLPESTRKALTKLADLVRAEPIPAPDARQMAHGLTTDGAFREWLGVAKPKPRQQKQDTTSAYRLLAKHLHPDRGGDEKAMQALNALRDAAR